MSTPASIQRLRAEDQALMEALLATFGEAFNEADTYGAQLPSAGYTRKLLASDTFIALVALKSGRVVGGLAAYELQKFERERSEIYIYDLAVAEPHRRQGIARALVEELKKIAMERGAYVIFVQADLEDAPALAFYSKIGRREDVVHFDIAVARP